MDSSQLRTPYPVPASGKDGVQRHFVLTLLEQPEAGAATLADLRHRRRRWEAHVHVRGPEYSLEDGVYIHGFLEVNATTIMSHEMHHNGRAHYEQKVYQKR